MKEKPTKPQAMSQQKYKQPPILKLSEGLSDNLEASFFLIINPGMEKQAVREVEDILHGKEIHPTVGGVQFNSTWGNVRQGQPNLKTASRVLVRVDQFGARDFQKLFRKVSGLPWKKWLKPGTALSVRASSHGSRLRIKKGIERTVTEAFEKTFNPPASASKGNELLCLVRLEDDLCTISLDLSGELLHKRGDREDVGRAPLRETWAASILAKASELIDSDPELKADFSSSWQWIEPMAGTAVFLREALRNESGSTARVFAMDQNYLVVAESNATSKAPSPKKSAAMDVLMSTFSKAWIVDQDPAQLARAESGLQEMLPKTKMSFHLTPPKIQESGARFVVLNPPWGVRLKGGAATDSAEAQSRLLAALKTNYQPRFAVVLLPDLLEQRPKQGGVKQTFQLPPGWQELEGFSFRAGGIPVTARFFKVSN